MSHRSVNLKNSFLGSSTRSYCLRTALLMSCSLASYTADNPTLSEQEQKGTFTMTKSDEKNTNYMNKGVIRDFKEKSFKDELTHSEAKKMLEEIGAESYIVNLASLTLTVCGLEGDFYEEKLPLFGASAVSRSFNIDRLENEIARIQENKITYIEFLQGIASAGVARYQVFLTGGKMHYVGRNGDLKLVG